MCWCWLHHKVGEMRKKVICFFAGFMTGFRNPKAHDNESITKEDALRKLIMISLLMFKIDERIITE